jgi:putative transposase
VVKPKAKRDMVEYIKAGFGLSNRRACSLLSLWRSTQRYKAKNSNKDEKIRQRMRQLVEKYRKWGCPLVHFVLHREGLVKNKKRTERIYYREEKLSLRIRKRRRKAATTRISLPQADRPNERWAMDFVHDSLWNGRKMRALTIIDVFSKESLHVELDTSIGGVRVCRILDQIVKDRGLPKSITVDNGPEFAGKALDKWAYVHQVTLDFIRPGKPVDNCYIESFNSRFRSECLNTNYFDSLSEARLIIEEWRKTYNDFRPHRTLKGLTPSEFAKKHKPKSTENLNLVVVQ